MGTAVRPIPKGYHSVTPYMMVRGAAQALEFYKKAFGAKERGFSPETLKGTPVAIHLYVENADETFAKAVAAGAKVERPLQNQFYGDRSGGLVDPYGHKWHIATHIEDVSEEELNRRVREWQKKGGQC